MKFTKMLWVKLILFLVFILILALIFFLSPIDFPNPTGNYGIGVKDYEFTDSKRLMFPGKIDNRRLKVSIYYPSTEKSKTGQYADSASVYKTMMEQYNLPTWIVSRMDKIKTHSSKKAPISNEYEKYPVIIYLHGHTGFRQMNTSINEDLVSKGFIVVAIESPIISTMTLFDDGNNIKGLTKKEIDPLINPSIDPSIPAPMIGGLVFEDGIADFLSKDVGFIIDKLEIINQFDSIFRGKMDLEHIGLYGVSMGSILGGEATIKEPRIKSIVLLDSPMTKNVKESGLSIPTLFITRKSEYMKAEGWNDWDIDSTLDSIIKTKENSKYDNILYIDGMYHSNFTDAPYWMRILKNTGMLGSIDFKKANEILRESMSLFFENTLIKNNIIINWETLEEKYPEVEVIK